MNKFTYKLATAASTAVLALGSFGPSVMGATSITINGNGSHSDSSVDFTTNNTTTVSQTNVATVNNDVDVKANTGDNDADDNTGGDVRIDTGDANSNVKVGTSANSNVANVSACCAGDTSVTVSGNGTDSNNDVTLDRTNLVSVAQTNVANVNNDVYVKAETGDNDADDNTGGDVEINTGDTDTDVEVKTAVNSNWASVGGSDEGGAIDVEISGNGSHSDNSVDLDFANTVVLAQTNTADVRNDVDVEAETGDNDAEDNTGGDVEINTGDADTDVKVSTEANFNAADLSGCGCEEDVFVKVAGNGTDSNNDVTGDFSNVVSAGQTNVADVDNDEVDVDAETGDNDANDNTGAVDADSDPSIDTGNADTDVTVHNELNSNVLGDVDFDMPDFDWSESFNGFVMWMMAHWS